VVRYHLPPLTRDEAPAYLNHRLRHAGTELELFEPAAHEARPPDISACPVQHRAG
jgi:general secretion pathway protein A